MLKTTADEIASRLIQQVIEGADPKVAIDRWLDEDVSTASACRISCASDQCDLNRGEPVGTSAAATADMPPGGPMADAGVVAETAVSTKPTLDTARIIAWMEQEGYTKDTLAKALGCDPRTISSIRNNGHYHGGKALTKLANQMGLEDQDELYLRGPST